jgi:hypothetical protein
MSIASNGNIGIGTTDTSSFKLNVNGNVNINNTLTAGDITFGVGRGNLSSDGKSRFYYINNGSSIYWGHGEPLFMFRDGVSNNNIFTISSSGTVVTGNFTVSGGTKSWRIKHPILENKDLIHVCIEGPRADNLYRGRKQLIDGECEVNLDLECNTTGGMTEGCFVLINKNIQVFVSNNETFDKVIGSVVGNKLTVTSDNVNASCFIDWLVIGERNDNEIINNASTSSNGSIIVEIDREDIHIRAPRTNYDTSNYDILEM